MSAAAQTLNFRRSPISFEEILKSPDASKKFPKLDSTMGIQIDFDKKTLFNRSKGMAESALEASAAFAKFIMEMVKRFMQLIARIFNIRFGEQSAGALPHAPKDSGSESDGAASKLGFAGDESKDIKANFKATGAKEDLEKFASYSAKHIQGMNKLVSSYQAHMEKGSLEQAKLALHELGLTLNSEFEKTQEEIESFQEAWKKAHPDLNLESAINHISHANNNEMTEYKTRVDYLKTLINFATLAEKSSEFKEVVLSQKLTEYVAGMKRAVAPFSVVSKQKNDLSDPFPELQVVADPEGKASGQLESTTSGVNLTTENSVRKVSEDGDKISETNIQNGTVEVSSAKSNSLKLVSDNTQQDRANAESFLAGAPAPNVAKSVPGKPAGRFGVLAKAGKDSAAWDDAPKEKVDVEYAAPKESAPRMSM